MSDPKPPSDPTPPVPPAPSYTYGSPSAPPAESSPSVPPPVSSPLPPPQYGERVSDPAVIAAATAPPAYTAGPDYTAGPGYAVPGAPIGAPGYPAAGAPVKRRRVWDIVLTCILLVLGLFGMGIALLYAAIFSDPAMVREVFDQAYRQAGLGGWNGTVGAAPAIIAVSHIVLYLVALGVSILLLVKNKIAFWVPLSAGVVAAIVFWGALMAIVMSDPSLMTGSLR